MGCQDYITEPAERKKGQHLQREERGAIQHLKRQGYSNRAMRPRSWIRRRCFSEYPPMAGTGRYTTSRRTSANTIAAPRRPTTPRRTGSRACITSRMTSRRSRSSRSWDIGTITTKCRGRSLMCTTTWKDGTPTAIPTRTWTPSSIGRTRRLIGGSSGGCVCGLLGRRICGCGSGCRNRYDNITQYDTLSLRKTAIA